MKKWARSSRGKSLEAWTGQAFIYDRRDIPNWVQLEDRWNLGASKSTDTQRGTGGPRDFGRSDFLELDWWLILDVRFMVSYLFMPATDAGTINYHVYIHIYICTRGTSPFASISLWRALPPMMFAMIWPTDETKGRKRGGTFRIERGGKGRGPVWSHWRWKSFEERGQHY